MGLLERLGFSPKKCTHRGMIQEVTRGSQGCAQCVALGDTWMHLRMCMSCGQVGCCDQSKNKHASRHAHDASHPIGRTVEPGEDWMWCYVDEMEVS